jgi:predicted hydrolase (HD superfamily)
MKLTNLLLIILTILLITDKFQHKETVISPQIKKEEQIQLVKTYEQTKSIIPEVLDKNKQIKHSTSLNNYFDTSNRQTVGITHNVRIGQDYYLSGGITKRSSQYYQDYGFNWSVTKYW